jgi:uncharacterized protein (DUF433 family)
MRRIYRGLGRRRRVEQVISAFSIDQVSRLTGLSVNQLRDWDVSGFFAPAYAAKKRRTPYSRIYSFEDVVGLRVLSILRSEHKIPLTQLRNVARKLRGYAGKPWSRLTLYVLNKEVHFLNPNTRRVEGAVTGQYASLVPISDVVEDMRAKANKLREREKEQSGKIEKRRFVVHNQAVIAGTRIPIAAVRRFADEGYGLDRILQQYPTLTRKDVEAALAATKDLTKAA